MASLFDNTSNKIERTMLNGPDMAMFAEVGKSWVVSKAQRYIKARDQDGVMRVYLNGCTPMRGVMNNQDPLHRVNYKCQKGKSRRMWENCDGTNVPTVSSNVKHIWNCSDYTRFRKGKEYLKMLNMRRYRGQIDHPVDISDSVMSYYNH
jgi:hypothetical protein